METILTKEEGREKKQNKYNSQLLKNLNNRNFTYENFSYHKKHIEDILLFLLDQIKHLGTDTQRTGTENIFSNLEEKGEILREYCLFIRSNKNIPEPYSYLGTIAHEYKEITGRVKAFTDLYEEGDIEKDVLIENIHIITDGIKEKIHKLESLEFTKNGIYEQKTFSPYEDSQKILDNHKNKINKKNIKITNSLPKENIISYKEIFNITIENLISNAIKFTPEGGEINIGVEKNKEDTITFFVKDFGVGIPENVDPFIHGYTTPSIDGNIGTGIGLSQSRLFIDAAGGYIQYEKNIPEGSTFTFLLKKSVQENDLQN